jgi:hypothetical protein
MVISKKGKERKESSQRKNPERRPPSCNFVSIFVLCNWAEVLLLQDS